MAPFSLEIGLCSALLVLTGLGLAHSGAPKGKEGVLLENDVVYGKGGDEDLRLDIARPNVKPLSFGGGIH